MMAARAALLVAVAVAIVGASPAAARSGGITGHSGKGRPTCNSSGCHSGGQRPDVAFVGPAQVTVGETETYFLGVHAASPLGRAAGFNVAVDAGVLTAIVGQGARVTDGELTHNEPKENDDRRLAGWDFRWTAPTAPGIYKLYGAGNSVNFNGQVSGDRGDTAVLEVQVVAAGDTATPTPTPIPTATPTPTVEAPSPTATATSDATASAQTTATSTASPTEPGFTPTIAATVTQTTTGSATPTTSATSVASTSPNLVCPGDCSDDGEVSISDLIRAVSVALGALPPGACPTVDANADGVVSIAELIGAVNNALNAC